MSSDRRIRGVMWKGRGFCFYALGTWDTEEFWQEALPLIRRTLGAAAVDAEPSICSKAVQYLRFRPLPEREALKQGQKWGVQIEKRLDRGYPVTAILIL